MRQTAGMGTQEKLQTKPAKKCSPVAIRTDERAITEHLLRTYGPILDREALVKVLAYPSGDAFDRSVQRGRLSLNLVRIPNRRGVFALAPEVGRYLVEVACGEVAVSVTRERER